MNASAKFTVEHFNRFGADYLPGALGIEIVEIGRGIVRSRMRVEQKLLAPNGYLHAGSVVTLADTSAGYGCIAHLPDGASGFTTIELKANFLATARQGILSCTAKVEHMGRTTQLWDATVTNDAGKTIALFRCTQLILR